MNSIKDSSPSITIKKKNLQLVIDFCIENKIDFNLTSVLSDEFKIEFLISSTHKAIALGMCMKELKIDFNGLNVVSISSIKANKKASLNTAEQIMFNDNEIKMAFEKDLQFQLGSTY